MKIQLVPVAVAFLSSLTLTYGNGTVNFANYGPGVDAIVYGADGITPVSGSNYKAQLYTGPDWANLVAVGSPVPFWSGVAAGYFFGGTTTTSVGGGQSATIQVRAWYAGGGATSWETASVRGESSIITVTTADADSSPPGIPPNLVGLQSFSLAQVGGAAPVVNPTPTVATTEASLPSNASELSVMGGQGLTPYRPGELLFEILLMDGTDSYLRLHGTVVGDQYQLLYSTDVALPVANWTEAETRDGEWCSTDFAPVPVNGHSMMFFVARDVGPTTSGRLDVSYCATAAEMAQWIMGPDVTVNHATATYVGDDIAKGKFGNGAAPVGTERGLPINSGVILATGDIANAIGPNDDHRAETDDSGPSDGSLEALVGGTATHDAAILEFDFYATTTSVTFEYVYASEEYPEWIDQYNDVMGIFIDGTDKADNIAWVPGTTDLPISVSNINGGCTFPHIDDTNPDYYSDNHDPVYDALDSDPDIVYKVQYDGLALDTNLQPLQAHATITANAWHHVKIAIADVNDSAFDSAVFLKATITCY